MAFSFSDAYGVTAIIGALASAQAAKRSAQSAQLNYRFQAEMADINAARSEKAAQRTLLAGQRQGQMQRLKTAQLKSSQRASLAANGIALDSDTAQNILNTTDTLGEIDHDQIEENALAAAWGYRMQGANMTAEGQMAGANAAGISPAGAFGTSLIGNATQVAGTWYQMRKAEGK